MIHPVICKEKSSTLIIKGDSLKQLKKKPKQILWVKDGIYGLIPVEAVKNQLITNEDISQIALVIGGLQRKRLVFYWNETVEISQSTGRSMEKYNGRKK